MDVMAAGWAAACERLLRRCRGRSALDIIPFEEEAPRLARRPKTQVTRTPHADG